MNLLHKIFINILLNLVTLQPLNHVSFSVDLWELQCIGVYCVIWSTRNFPFMLKMYSVGLFIKYECSISSMYGIIVCFLYVQIVAFIIEMFIHNLAQ